jgi:hypothetical protein
MFKIQDKRLFFPLITNYKKWSDWPMWYLQTSLKNYNYTVKTQIHSRCELCRASIYIQPNTSNIRTKTDIRTKQLNSSNVDNYNANETQFLSENVDRQTLYALGYYLTSAAALQCSYLNCVFLDLWRF